MIWGRGVGGINLTRGVGSGRSNRLGDVILVQALLNFIVDGFEDASKVGLHSSSELPDVNGHWDVFLDKAIIAFERKHSNLLRYEHPGQISPVSDPFDLQDEELWPPILLLNQFAEDATGMARNREVESGGKDPGFPYPTPLLIMFPQLVTNRNNDDECSDHRRTRR